MYFPPFLPALVGRFKRTGAPMLAVLMCFGLLPTPAPAQELFRVENLLVRGAGDGSEAARKRAFEMAHIAALRQVVGRVTSGTAADDLPLPSMEALSAMVEELDVADERMNELTYVGLMSFTFEEAAITAFLAENGIRFSVAQARPFIILPVLAIDQRRLLWESNNSWASAWRDPRFRNGLLPFLVPEGDGQDRELFNLNSITRAQVANAARDLALRYDAAGVLLAEARLLLNSTGQLTGAEILINRRGSSLGPERYTHNEPATPGDRPLDLLIRAAEAASEPYTAAWKRASAVEGQELTTLTFETDSDNLDTWFALEQALLSVGIIEAVDLLSLGDGAIVADLTFRGRLDQLTRILAQQRLELIPAGNRFFLAQR